MNRERERGGDRIGDEETGILRRQRGERETLEVKYYCVMVRVVSSRGQRSVGYRLAGSAYVYTDNSLTFPSSAYTVPSFTAESSLSLSFNLSHKKHRRLSSSFSLQNVQFKFS